MIFHGCRPLRTAKGVCENTMEKSQRTPHPQPARRGAGARLFDRCLCRPLRGLRCFGKCCRYPRGQPARSRAGDRFEACGEARPLACAAFVLESHRTPHRQPARSGADIRLEQGRRCRPLRTEAVFGKHSQRRHPRDGGHGRRADHAGCRCWWGEQHCCCLGVVKGVVRKFRGRPRVRSLLSRRDSPCSRARSKFRKTIRHRPCRLPRWD